MTKLTLPNGKSQFIDANGKPLAGGKVYHYVPATTTPKNTWQDGAGTILNTNPVTLDAAGEAVILGSGSYRQIVTDSLGNLQWDQVTTAPDGIDSLPLTGGTLTGALFAPSIGITGGQLLPIAPTGDAVATLASLNVQGTTTSSTVREYLAAISLVANKRNGASGSVQPSIALYLGVEGASGTGDIWTLRTILTQDGSSGTYNAIADEITVENSVANRGEALGAAGLAAPFTYGHVVDGTGPFRSTSAYLITGPGTAVFNRGFTIEENAVAQASFQDLGNASISYEIQGTHTYGIDTKAATFSQAAIRLGNGQYVKARDVGDTVDITVFVQSGTNLIIGDAGHGSTNVSGTHILPLSDNALTLGSSGFRWSAVWAANGAIQTSDPTLKTDINAIPADVATGLLSAIDPITYRWKVGGYDIDGNERPGKRMHWGWDASQVKAAFDAAGMDFGGYVLAEDGTQHLRPDQLVPVLWRVVQMLLDRVEALEKGTAP